MPPLQIANPSGYVTELEKQNLSSERQPAASATEQTPEQPNIAEAVAQYAALGGPLGGGFAAPPVDTNVLGYDWTAPFRERVGMCSKLDGVEPGDKFSIKIRISFNRDGTLMSPPHLLVPAPSAKQIGQFKTAGTDGAGNATASDSAAPDPGGNGAAPVGTGSDASRAGAEREDRARETE